MSIQVNIKCGNYFVNDGSAIKIGVSDDIDRRLPELQTGNSQPLILLAYIPCRNKFAAEDQERRSQNHFMDFHLQGEWYSISDDQVYEFCKEQEGIILNETVKQNKRSANLVSTIFGKEHWKETIPPCYVYSDRYAHCHDRAQTSENRYRSIRLSGVDRRHPSFAGTDKDGTSRVYISQAVHDICRNLVKSEKIETVQNRLKKMLKLQEATCLFK
jgi:hypothetical protein